MYTVIALSSYTTADIIANDSVKKQDYKQHAWDTKGKEVLKMSDIGICY